MTPLAIDVVLAFLLLTLNIELPAKNVVQIVKMPLKDIPYMFFGVFPLFLAKDAHQNTSGRLLLGIDLKTGPLNECNSLPWFLYLMNFIMTLCVQMSLLLLQQKEEDVQNGVASAALKTEDNDTPLINWSAPTYQKTVYALISLNFICFLFGCAYEVFRRKYFKGIKSRIKPESIRKN